MNVLAIETSSQGCSCAIVDSTDRHVERYERAPRQHTRLILGMVEAVLTEAQLTLKQLDSIAISHGPGSFTGVRIGLSVAQGLAVGADLPLTPVSSLRALAQGGLRRFQAGRVVAAFDARLGEVYLGAYISDGQGIMQPEHADCLIRPQHLKVQLQGSWTAMGDAWLVYENQLRNALDVTELYGDEYPSALDVAYIGRSEFNQGLALAPGEALPNYLRIDVAKVKSNNK
jgi:tRNA threonylcarbamoyladenosine biosynthesis protein TsaB